MRVLLASDGSSDAMQAAQRLAASGVPTGASILVFSVMAPPGDSLLPAPVADRLREEGRNVTKHTRAAVGPNWTDVAVRVAEGDAREEIMRVAENWDADLVVMGHGDSAECKDSCSGQSRSRSRGTAHVRCSS